MAKPSSTDAIMNHCNTSSKYQRVEKRRCCMSYGLSPLEECHPLRVREKPVSWRWEAVLDHYLAGDGDVLYPRSTVLHSHRLFAFLIFLDYHSCECQWSSGLWARGCFCSLQFLLHTRFF